MVPWDRNEGKRVWVEPVVWKSLQAAWKLGLASKYLVTLLTTGPARRTRSTAKPEEMVLSAHFGAMAASSHGRDMHWLQETSRRKRTSRESFPDGGRATQSPL